MDPSNVINTFKASELEGKSLEGILSHFRGILISAKEEGFEDFELVWNEEEAAFTAIGIDKMHNYVIPPQYMGKILEGLGVTD